MPSASTVVNTNGYNDATTVTPNDGVDLPARAVGLYVAVTGNVSFITPSGITLSATAHPVGVIPIPVARVRATGTTATVWALY